MILKIIVLQSLILYNLKIVIGDINESSDSIITQRYLTIKQIRNRRISTIKCEEYDAATRNANRSKRISNGQIVEEDKFPHMAAVGWIRAGLIKYLCAGSLISDQWVITSAHCAHNKMGYPKVVKLGSNDLQKNSGEVLKIIKILKHPKFKPPHLYDDIGLLKLEQTVTFKNNVKPACLYTKFETVPATVWATGWGSTRNGSYDPSNELMKVKLDTVDNIKCSLAFGHITTAASNGITSNMLCAGDLLNDWKSDTCKGDSGGPIQINHMLDNRSSLFDIVGITSFGKLCAVKNIPGVYTRVSHYVKWIEEIVWPDF